MHLNHFKFDFFDGRGKKGIRNRKGNITALNPAVQMTLN